LEVSKWPVPFLQLYIYSSPEVEFTVDPGDKKFHWLADHVAMSLKRQLINPLIYPRALVRHFTGRGWDWYHSFKAAYPQRGDVANPPSTLMLVIERAENLFYSGEFYCTASINTQEFKTKTSLITANPCWNEVFCFDIRNVGDTDGKLFFLCLFTFFQFSRPPLAVHRLGKDLLEERAV